MPLMAQAQHSAKAHCTPPGPQVPVKSAGTSVSVVPSDAVAYLLHNARPHCVGELAQQHTILEGGTECLICCIWWSHAC